MSNYANVPLCVSNRKPGLIGRELPTSCQREKDDEQNAGNGTGVETDDDGWVFVNRHGRRSGICHGSASGGTRIGLP